MLTRPARNCTFRDCWLLAQVRLLYDGRERGRMYAAYALSSVMTPDADLDSMRAAGVVPALIAVLNTSRVSSVCPSLLFTTGSLTGSLSIVLQVIIQRQCIPFDRFQTAMYGLGNCQ